MLEDLNPGASDETLAILERSLGQPVPTELRASLTLHDGESDGWPSRVFADLGAYLSTAGILETWTQRLEVAGQISAMDGVPDLGESVLNGLCTVDGPVLPVMYHSSWIPVMECNGDVFWALDLNPAPGGTEGQMIEVDWELCSWKVVAPSFGAFLADYALNLQRGVYRIVDGLPTRSQPV